jgi:L-fuculose-phosphate aldolase
MTQDISTQWVKQEIIRFGRELHQRKLICGYDGNISFRLGKNEYLITKSWSSLGFLVEDDIVKIDHDGNLLDGKYRPTGEYRLHMVAYRERPDIYCVIHAHPMYATVWASWDRSIPAFILPEIGVVFGEDLPIAPYASTGTPQIAESIAELIRKRDGVLLSRHGAVTVSNKGPEVALLDAYNKMEKIEYAAEIIYHLESRQKVAQLPDDEIARLRAARESLGMGVKSSRFQDPNMQPA